MEETRLIYFLEDREDKVPFMVKLNVAPDQARLRDVKRALSNNGRSFKFFFKTNDPELGTVKEELIDDDSKLPIENGRVVLHLVPMDGGAGANTKSQTSLNDKSEYGQFSSMNSIASSGSSSTGGNNENRMMKSQQPNNYGYLAPQNSNLQQQQQQQQQQHRKSKSSNYDSLTRKQQQQHRQTINTPLKEFNFDDTSTETESLVDEFNGLKMIPQNNNKPGAQQHQQHHASTKRHLSLNNHQNGHHNHQAGHHLVRGGSLGGHHQAHGNEGHYYHHHHQQQQQPHHHGHHPYHNPIKTGGNMLLPARSTNKQFDAVSLLSENETTTFFDTVYDDGDDDDDDDDIDDDDDHVSSISGSTATTAASSVLSKREKRRKMSSRRYGGAGALRGANFLQRHNSMHSSMSSLADSTMSINIITVRLNMDSANFLGISIVGQSNKKGEGGIYVGSIMQGGAVAQDGQIDAGDMILQVNDISFENMSNDEAVRVLREAVAKAGPLKLVVAKCWESLPKGYFQVSKQDKVFPINPQAWVAHTQAHTQAAGNKGLGGNRAAPPFLNHSVSSLGSEASFSTFANSSITSVDFFGPRGGNYAQQQLLPHRGGPNGNNNNNNHYGVNNMPTVLTSDSTRFGCTQELNLTAESDMELIMRTMSSPDSGLDIRERNWLKITIPDAFIGRDVVEWLFNHVEGFPERRDAQKYASMMLKNGYIRSAVNRPKFSEHSYYVFGDQTTFITQNGTQGQAPYSLFTLDEEHEDDFDSVSEYDRDSNNYAPMSFPPLPPPQSQQQQQQPPQLIQAQGFNKLQPASSMSSSSSTSSTQPPGLTFNSNMQQQFKQQQQQGKIYSNVVVGIGGPGSNDPSNMMSNNGGGGSGNYHSSSSSNVTSNSTSTTSQNTTASASHIGGVISSDHRANSACQLYYPTPALFNNNSDNSQTSWLSQFNTPKPTASNTILNDQTTINDTMTTQINAPPPNSFLSQSHNTTVTNSVNNTMTNSNNMLSTTLTASQSQQKHRSNGSDNRSVKSSDNSSSGGNASDQELISSCRSKMSRNNSSSKNIQSSSNYYDVGRLTSNGPIIMSTTTTTMTTTTTAAAARALDKVPKDVRLSKQSFCQAMENPCEFFVDVM